MATAVGGVVVSKPMAKKTTCLSGIFLRQRHGIGARINHADVAARAFAFSSDRPSEAGTRRQSP
jgi:hypothetical protein